MNILLTTAVMIAMNITPAQAQPETYQMDLASNALLVQCPPDATDIMCVDVQGRTFAIVTDKPRPVGSDFTVAFTMECDYDENCKVVNVYDAD